MEKKTTAQIGTKTFISSFLILLMLIITAGGLTWIIPAGEYSRVYEGGKLLIKSDSFKLIDKGGLPFHRWLSAPFEVLVSQDAAMVISIIIFIIIVAGAFGVLEKTGILTELINKIVIKYKHKRYKLLCIVSFVFMIFGAFLGLFEEMVPLVPIVLILSYQMGWDSLIGLGMSILSGGFGFAVAISNPFTVGIAQKIAGLPIFSGALFRIVLFVCVYLILAKFLTDYAKKIDRHPESSLVFDEDRKAVSKDLDSSVNNKNINHKCLKRAYNWFLFCMALLLIFVLAVSTLGFLADYSMPVVGAVFLLAGLGAGIASGIGVKRVAASFISGAKGILPGIILILMAVSVKFIISEGGIMDTILYYGSNFINESSPITAGFIIYALVLVLEFFVGSSSAKAFLVLPIIFPIADMVGITRQSAVQAFCFGDGFSNIIYPTNAVLLISLGLTPVSYAKWFKWTVKLQGIMFIVTAVFLAISIMIKYGPF